MARVISPRFSRLSPALFLVAAIGAVILIGAQAVMAVRSQERLTQRVLREHAATAAWNLEPRLREALSALLECGFHPALHGAAGEDVLPVTPSADEVRARWGNCEGVRPSTMPRWVIAMLPGREPDVAGQDPPDAEAVERAIGSVVDRSPVGRNHYVVVADLGAPTLVGYLKAIVRGGVGYWVVPLDGQLGDSLLAYGCRSCALLPPTVWPEGTPNDLLTIRLDPGSVWYGDTARAVVASATRQLEAPLEGLSTTVRITPEAATLLAPESVTRSRLPLLGVMLAISLGLVILAYRQLRREQELARLRTDFVSSVSHELRTPLALQRIFLDTIALGRAAEPERMAWALENMNRETLRLQLLINNILQFSKSNRGPLKLNLAPADLAHSVARTIETLAPLAARSNTRIELHATDGVGVSLEADAFHQAVANLLENAIKYGPEGQVVDVSVGVEGAHAIVLVDDQGPGVPPEERDVVFEPFRRGRVAVGTTATGTGIGLSVVRDVVRAHGGDVRIETAPAGGARLRVSLPLRKTPPTPLAG